MSCSWGEEAIIPAIVIDYYPDIEPCTSVRCYGDIFTVELLAVWYISFGTGEASFSETEVDQARLSRYCCSSPVSVVPHLLACCHHSLAFMTQSLSLYIYVCHYGLLVRWIHYGFGSLARLVPKSLGSLRETSAAPPADFRFGVRKLFLYLL